MELAALDDDALTAVIHDHLHYDPAAQDIWDELTAPGMIGRTQTILKEMLSNVEGQLADRAAGFKESRSTGYERGDDGKAEYFAARAEYNRWRKKALRFKRLIDRRLSFVFKKIDGGSGGSRRRLAHKQNLDALYDLARAVTAHQRALAGDGTPEPEDEQLWDTLDVIVVATSMGDMTLGEWVAYTESARGDTPGA